jgi:hypothetical protein
MKVLLGSFNQDLGTVELPDAGGDLVCDGLDPEKVRTIVEHNREWWDRSGGKHLLTDEELVRSLPYRMQGGFAWAVSVDERTGLTQDQPEYDPWGEVWRDGKAKPDWPPVSYPPIPPGGPHQACGAVSEVTPFRKTRQD